MPPDRILNELEILRRNIQEMQAQLQSAYVRIGELTADLQDTRRQKSDAQLLHADTIFDQQLNPVAYIGEVKDESF